MGTGKTSVGKILGKKLKKTVLDVDQWIESKEKRSIAEIFEKDGEAYFRRVEKEAVRAVASETDVVITTGGGVVLDAENMKALSENAWVVALHASPEVIYQRVKNSRHRPLLQGPDKLSEITKIMKARKLLYDRADISLDTDQKSAGHVAELILKALKGKK